MCLVPEYNVVHPIQVDENGAFISHELTFPRIRMRRSSNEPENEDVHYRVSAFGNDLHLHLERNKRLLAPNFKVEVIGKHGRVMKRHSMENCHYVGKLKERSRTTVAISNCQGLVSSFHSRENVWDREGKVQSSPWFVNFTKVIFWLIKRLKFIGSWFRRGLQTFI